MPLYKHARPRGFAPWNPNDETLEIIAQVAHILELEKAYLPLTNRQIFYRMVASFGYSKTENAYSNLCEKLNRARRAGLIDWDSIRDDGLTDKSGHFYWGPSTLQYVLQRECRNFLLLPDMPQPCKVEVFIEAAGMLPQVARVANPLGVTCYSSGGFSSVTVQRDTAKRLAERDKPTVILSIGDYDPSGVALYQSFKENVLAFFDGWSALGGTEAVCDDAPLFRRIAITPDQIRQYDFITAPPKKTDKRGNWTGGTVQCEAIPSATLADIVKDAVCEHYDLNAITDMLEFSSDVMRERLEDKVASLDFDPEESDAQEYLEEVKDSIEDNDWTGGYCNEDDDDMEEGV